MASQKPSSKVEEDVPSSAACEEFAPADTINTNSLNEYLAENVSYGSLGVRAMFTSPFVSGAAFLASLGGFSFGYDQGVMSIINTMEQFHNVFPRAKSAFGTSFMTAMLQLGCFVGCWFFPWLADTISRKWALTVVVVIFVIGAIIQTAAENYAALVAGRTITGVGVGTLSLGAPLYISEISPPNLRGTLLVLESISICAGAVVAFWTTYGTKDLSGEISFRLPFGLQMVTAVILGVGIHFFPYSPRWLALVGRDDECLQTLGRLRRLPLDDSRIQSEHLGIVAEVRAQKTIQAKHHPGASGFKLELYSWLDLFSNRIIRRTIVGMGIMFFQQFSGVNAFIYYAPTLFQSIGQSPSMSLILSGVFNILQLVAAAACFLIIDNVGRRPLAIFGGFGTFACYTIIAALSGVYEDDWPSNKAAGWACVAMAFLFIIIFGLSFSPLGWTLPAEVFPTSCRSKGVALSVATCWLANFIIGVAVPPMIESLRFGTYVFFACFCFASGIFSYFLIPETKGKTLEEMDAAFGDSGGAEGRQVMENQLIMTRRASAAAGKTV